MVSRTCSSLNVARAISRMARMAPLMTSKSTSDPTMAQVRIYVCFRSDSNMPAAQNTEDSRGTSKVSMPSSRAMGTACIGPAPPATIMANSRGSRPRCTVTTVTALLMIEFATR